MRLPASLTLYNLRISAQYRVRVPSDKDICRPDRRFPLASFLHSLWLVRSVDRPNREIELVMV